MLIYTSAYTDVSLDYREILFKAAYSVLGYPSNQTAELRNFSYRWISYQPLLRMSHMYFSKMGKSPPI